MSNTNQHSTSATKNVELMRGPANGQKMRRSIRNLKAAGFAPRHSHGALWIAPEHAQPAAYIVKLSCNGTI